MVSTSDKGCQDSTTKTVTVNSHPVAAFTVLGANSFCNGDSTILRSIPGTGYSYQWRKGNNNIPQATNDTYAAKQSGTYSLITTNPESCSDTSVTEVTITVIEYPTISIQPQSKTIQEDDSVQFDVTTADTGISYQWQEDKGAGYNNLNNGSPYGGSTTQALDITGAPLTMDGYKYRCRLSVQGCATTSGEAILNVTAKPNGLNEILKENITVYPNPTDNEITIKVPPTLLNQGYVITDQLGKTIQTGKLDKEINTIDLRQISTGVYFFNTAGAKAVRIMKK